MNSLFRSTFVLLLLVGGALILTVPLDGADDKLECEPMSWLEAKPSSPVPGVKICALMVYDSESDVSILFGGYDSENLLASPETWAYDYETNTWTEMTPANSPPGRFGQGLIYDEGRDRVFTFLGLGDNSTYFNDMWEYDYNTNTWTELFPSESPFPRCKGGCSYDIESDQIISFGGFGADGVKLDETWTYNYDENTWVNRTSDAAPAPRMRCPMMYDEESDITLLFGGWIAKTDVLDDAEVYGDTWVYDFNTNTWTDMDPSVSPEPRARYGRAYLPEEGVVLMTHGWSGTHGDFNDTWTYDYDTNTWTEVEMGGEVATKRHCTQMALDEESGVIVMVGGSGESSFKDTWVLNPYEASPEDDPSNTIFIIIGLALLVLIIIAVIIYEMKKSD